MAITKEQRLAAIHEKAVKEFDQIQSAVYEERMQCLEDRRFYSIAGAQWEGALADQFENKPKFEVNKIHLAVIRIINEYRNNRITVDFVSKEGAEYDKLADTCDDLYRADEQDSVAEEAYDNAFEEAVGGGFGAWRLRAEYENEEDGEDDKQRVRIEPIFDADSSVFFNLGAKRQDKADAKSCYVLASMSPEDYMDEYDDDPATWNKSVTLTEFDWYTPNVVYIAEYYRIEEKSELLRIWRTIDGEDQTYHEDDFEDPMFESRLLATGSREVRQRKIKRKRVHKYIMSGGKILEDCGLIAGKCIPIVPVYGKRWFVDNVERCMGHVRLAKDAQRLKNMQLSKLGEISALSTVEKPILTPEQISGHQEMWSEDNVKNYPYMLINPVTDQNGNQMPAGPVAYTRAPTIPQAMAALLQITEQDIQDLLGNQQAGEQLQPNMSGKAVELVQNRLDMQTFIYVSNMSKAVKRSGEIWLSMARDIFVEEGRKMKGIGAQGEVQSVELLKATIDPESGDMEVENDLSKAEFDVAVEVGPSSGSKRAATVRGLTGMMTITDDPETKQVLGAMAMMNMEGEGIGDVRDYFRRKLLKMGVVKPSEEEAKVLAEALANAKPDANEEYLKAAASEADANAKQANAKTILTLAQAEVADANIEKTKADTVKTLSEVDAQSQQQAFEFMDKLGAMNQQQ